MSSIQISTGSVLGSRWLVGELLGEGACGKVFIAKSVLNTHYDYELVIKIIPIGVGKTKKAKDQDRIANTLNYEYMLYTGPLSGFPYAPKLPEKFYGTDLGVRYLVMEKLDMDLVSYSKNSNPNYSMIAKIGLQLLLGLEWLHKKGFLFIDIKPQNFMIKNDKVYFIDYGLVERWISYNSVGSRIAEAREMVGTPAFASISVHRGETPSRKDDIESMALVLLSLSSEGRLPWSNSTSDEQCKSMKESCDIMELASERDCKEIGEIIMISRDLSYSDVPDYRKFEELLKAMESRKPNISTASTKRLRNSASGTSKTSAISLIDDINIKVSVNSKNNNKKSSSNELNTKAIDSEVPSHEINISSTTSSLNNISSPIIKKSKSEKISNRVVKSSTISTNENINISCNLPFSSSSSQIESTIIKKMQSSDIVDNTKPISKIKLDDSKPFSSNTNSKNNNSVVIEVLKGKHKGDFFNIKDSKDLQFIGRATDNNIYSLPNDDYVSERHLKVKVEDGKLSVMDNDSSHGVKVDGIQLRKKRLFPKYSFK